MIPIVNLAFCFETVITVLIDGDDLLALFVHRASQVLDQHVPPDSLGGRDNCIVHVFFLVLVLGFRSNIFSWLLRFSLCPAQKLRAILVGDREDFLAVFDRFVSRAQKFEFA